MDRADAIEVLALAATYDHRKESEAQEASWSRALWDVSRDEAVWAVDAHYSREVDRIMPAHVRRLVIARRNDDHDRRALPAAPGVPPTPAYLAARAALDAALAARPRAATGDPTPLGQALAEHLPDTTERTTP